MRSRRHLTWTKQARSVLAERVGNLGLFLLSPRTRSSTSASQSNNYGKRDRQRTSRQECRVEIIEILYVDGDGGGCLFADDQFAVVFSEQELSLSRAFKSSLCYQSKLNLMP